MEHLRFELEWLVWDIIAIRVFAVRGIDGEGTVCLLKCCVGF